MLRKNVHRFFYVEAPVLGIRKRIFGILYFFIHKPKISEKQKNINDPPYYKNEKHKKSPNHLFDERLNQRQI